MTIEKPALSTRLNRFWARLLPPINAYLGTALIVLALMMALIGLMGGHMGGRGPGLFGFGLGLAVGLAAIVGLVARLIQIEGHLAAIRKGMENGPAAPTQPLPKKARAKAKSPKTRQTKRRG